MTKVRDIINELDPHMKRCCKCEDWKALTHYGSKETSMCFSCIQGSITDSDQKRIKEREDRIN